MKFDPRRLMELAVEVMKKSVAEPRETADAPPKVGAVLWKPDATGSDTGTVETAFRGELRDGDHAEYTLLERKNRANALDGCVLFATLEPCAPGARKHPKLGCAERIVNARIKKVWVGVQDPHPKVAGKGFVFLDSKGVSVTWFDRDLQDIIKKENAEFFKQAELKAEAGEHHEEPVVEEYEKPAPHTEFADLSQPALRDYLKSIGVQASEDSDTVRTRLLQQGLLEKNGHQVQPTGFANLLFGKHPRDLSPEAGLLVTIHYDNGSEELKDFDGPLVTVPVDAIEWLKSKLPNPTDRSEARRKDSNEKFFEMVREGIVNALVHRDYSIKAAKSQLIVTPEFITIKSPGRPVKPITVQQLQSFEAPMVSRNPMLHVVFSRMEMAEERGLGLKSMKGRASELGLPLPKYEWEEPYVVLTLYRSVTAARSALGREMQKVLSKAEKTGWEWLSTREKTTSSEYAESLNLPYRTAMNHMKHFQELGLLKKSGDGRATEYNIRRP